MARCIFENLTLAQAQTLANWFEGQGEQSAEEWFEIHAVPVPTVDVQDKNCIRQIGGDIVVRCR